MLVNLTFNRPVQDLPQPLHPGAMELAHNQAYDPIWTNDGVEKNVFLVEPRGSSLWSSVLC